jgi:hypothetical protein
MTEHDQQATGIAGMLNFNDGTAILASLVLFYQIHGNARDALRGTS